MMTTDLSLLLAELREKDPETCNEILQFELAGYHQPRNQVLDHLQGCLQRACEKRGWDTINWQIKFNAEIGYVFQSRIIMWRKNGNKWQQFFAKSKSSPAHALLKAYLAALP